MIIVETSALIAIVKAEPEGPGFVAAIVASGDAVIAAASVLEATMKATSALRVDGRGVISGYVQALALTVMPFDESQLAFAQDAFVRFGKGQGHPAQLNFGDCFSYALARALSAPLLFKGSDFSHTDVLISEASTP